MDIVFKNFIHLTLEEKELVLKYRNTDRVRLNMINNDIIPMEQHLNWLDSLKNMEDCKYYIVYINNISVAAFYFTSIDYANKKAEWGFYLFEENIGYGALIEYLGIEYFFYSLNFNLLYCKVLTSNTRTYNLHINSFFFSKDTLYDEKIINNNSVINLLGLSMKKEVWDKKKYSIKNKIYKLFKIKSVLWKM